MVRGLQFFQEYFSEFTDQYVLIGGTACDLLMDEAGLDFRATKDLDIVFCVEALRPEFVDRFWEFVRRGGYEVKEKANGRKCFYRFAHPQEAGYPAMLELFSRKPDILQDIKGIIAPICIEDNVMSLSSVLLEDDYYHFINKEKRIIAGVPVVGVSCLIPLKARAWMDLSERKFNGEAIDSRSINKHKNDVFRLFQILNPTHRPFVPGNVKKDMQRFLVLLENEEVNLAQLGISQLTKSEIIQSLRAMYCE